MFGFSSQITSAAGDLSIWNFMSEIKLVVTEKSMFLSGNESKLMVHFGIFRLPQLYFHDSGNIRKRNSKYNFLPKILVIRLRP